MVLETDNVYFRLELPDELTDAKQIIAWLRPQLSRVSEVYLPPKRTKGGAFNGFIFEFEDYRLASTEFITAWCQTTAYGLERDDLVVFELWAKELDELGWTKDLLTSLDGMEVQIDWGIAVEMPGQKLCNHIRVICNGFEEAAPASIKVRESSANAKSPSPARDSFWEAVSEAFAGEVSERKPGSGYSMEVLSNDPADAVERFWKCEQALPPKSKLRWSKVQVSTRMQHVEQVARKLQGYRETLSFWVSGMYHEDFSLPQISEPPAEGHWRFPLIKINLFKDQYARFDLVTTLTGRFIEVWGPSKPLLSRWEKLPFADSMQQWQGPAKDRWNLFSTLE